MLRQISTIVETFTLGITSGFCLWLSNIDLPHPCTRILGRGETNSP
jgi:hypothetical protein